MFLVWSIASNVATGAGLVAAAIAVTGFVFHAGPALSGGPEERLRRATVIGGLIGLCWALFVILLSALID
jgi:hypothetical protein